MLLAVVRFLLHVAWFVLQALFHQVLGPGRVYVNCALLVAVGAVYFSHERYGLDNRALIGFSVGVLILVTVRYAIFSIRKRRAEANAARVAAGAFGVPDEEQIVRVKGWQGRHPSEFEVVIPTKIGRSDLEAVEAQVRQRLLSPPGCEWGSRWDLHRHKLYLATVPALPTTALYRDEVKGLELAWHELPVAVGRSGLMTWDCELFPHVLIGGTTGGGKSTALLAIVAGAVRSGWIVQCVDLKRVELGHLNGRKKALRVATDLGSALEAIEKVQDLMHDRYDRMAAKSVKHFKQLKTSLPAVMLVIDELAELVSMSGIKTREAKEEDEMRGACLKMIEVIARMGRAAGVHLVLATQRPDAAILPGAAKINVEARLALGRLNPVSSEMVIESRAAAELVSVPGRGLWRTPQGIEEVQVLYADERDLDRPAKTGPKESKQAARGVWRWPKPPRRRKRRSAKR